MDNGNVSWVSFHAEKMTKYRFMPWLNDSKKHWCVWDVILPSGRLSKKPHRPSGHNYTGLNIYGGRYVKKLMRIYCKRQGLNPKKMKEWMIVK